MKHNFKSSITQTKKGFSLAEVLLAITIIGIIASMTIPELISNVQDSSYKSGWKKIYSELSEATALIKEENGGSMMGIGMYYRDIYKPRLSVVKTCDWGDYSCWHAAGNSQDLRGVPVTSGREYSLILSSGALLHINGLDIPKGNNLCDAFSLNILRCGFIMVDINGFKGPNTIGKDIYGIHITKQGLVPYGGQNDSFYNNSKCDTIPPDNIWWERGWACSMTSLTQ